MQKVIVICFLIFCVFANLKCPPPQTIQSDYVKENFNPKKMIGTYYELALHDYTQPDVCGCQRSVKTMPNDNQIYDNFTLTCPKPPQKGKIYPNDLSFNLTDIKGYFRGHWPFTKDEVFPDTVVDVHTGYDESGNLVYDWVIEFQCLEKLGVVDFAGINFYSRKITDEYRDQMYVSARKYGLQPFMDEGLKMRNISFEGCSWPSDEDGIKDQIIY